MCEIICKNAVDGLATDGNRIQRMRGAYWVFWGYRARDTLVTRTRLNDVYWYMVWLMYFVKNAWNSKELQTKYIAANTWLVSLVSLTILCKKVKAAIQNNHISAFNDEIDLGWWIGITPTFRITGTSLAIFVNVVQIINVCTMQIRT
jgi:hypothetical protein